jgi:hypothetical protein
MAVPSILVAVIADEFLENDLFWGLCRAKKGEEEVVIEVGVKNVVDRLRKFRPRDLTLFLATRDEAEPPYALEAVRPCSDRGKIMIFGLGNNDSRVRCIINRMWTEDDCLQCPRTRVNMTGLEGKYSDSDSDKLLNPIQ